MSARARYMARVSADTDRLIAGLPLEGSELSTLHARIGRLNRDCGCGAGGGAMLSSAVVAVAYFALSGAVDASSLALGAGAIFVASLVGKALGLTVASVRLGLLRRSLAHRLNRELQSTHVHVY